MPADRSRVKAAAGDAAGDVDIDGRRIVLSNLDRVLWPAAGFTKGDMIEYYRSVADVMLPHLAGRPVMLARFPTGVHGRGWGQFECRGHPAWMTTAALELRTGVVRDVCLVNDRASLVWIANQGVVELHPFLARSAAFDRPLSVVFDLDPGPPAGMAECATVALRLRSLLAGLGLASHAKTSGSAGLHVFVPLDGSQTYRETKAFARAIAAQLAEELPSLVLDRVSRSARTGRVFIDWAQNDERKQTVAPYSLRAVDRPRVSTPVTWDEVARAAGGGHGAALAFEARDVVARIRERGDLFAGMLTGGHRLPAG